MIYLDSAATSFFRPPCVAEAVAEAISSMGNCSRGAYKEALTGARVIFETRVLLSEMFHGDGPEQVAFTANSTESLNIAIKGLIRPGDRVVTTVLEHNSVLRPLYEMEKQGAELVIVGCEQAPESAGEEEKERVRRLGKLDYKALKAAITPGTRAVVMTHASNLTGHRTDLKKVGEWCRQAGALFIVDASQTAGHFPINIEENHIDVLCFTGHKSLMGPQGTGGLCVGAGVEIRPFAVGGTGVQSYSETQPEAYPTRLEAGTLNSHGIAGLGASLAFLKRTGWDAVRTHESVLARRFYETVRTIPGVKVYGNFAVQLRAPIVSLNIANLDSSEVADELAERFEIATRPGAHCAPRLHRALGTEDQGAVRFSWSYFNTEAETDAAAEAVRILAAEAV